MRIYFGSRKKTRKAKVAKKICTQRMEATKRKCRICGEMSKEDMINIFSISENGQQVLQLIKQYLPILIYRSDPLPKEICGVCHKNIINYNTFYTKSMNAYATYKSELSNNANDPHVKLYLDSLENQSEFFGEASKFSDLMQKCFKTRTSSKCTNTLPEVKEEPVSPVIKNLKILTPTRINEISQKSTNSDDLSSSQMLDEDERPRKRRRLIGPKSRINLHLHRSYNPPTLLQIALKQINKNLALDNIQTSDSAEHTENTENTETETEDVDSLNRPNSSASSMSLMEPMPEEMSEGFEESQDQYSINLNLDEPAECNYCMKTFENISELALHEIQHIKVVVGPKLESKEFLLRRRRFWGLYQDYLQRQREAEALDLVQVASVQPPEFVEPFNDTQATVLPPANSSNTSKFELIGDEVFVNGVKLISIEKAARRRYYKEVVVNGVKRKYCPLCRHTFKDNWSIEYHYFNNVCQYTCKFCGIKFKFQKGLFEDHMKIHVGESATKIFGPSDRRYKFRKKKLPFTNRPSPIPPKVKPLKMKNLLQKKLIEIPPINIKTEPDLPPIDDSVTLEATGGNNQQPYQAFFCRKCFAVFYKIDQYNGHIQNCTGSPYSAQEVPNKVPTKSVAASSSTESFSSSQDSLLRRRLRAPRETIDTESEKSQEDFGTGYECGICCSSFPSQHSRNSHMRIHKTAYLPNKASVNKVPSKTQGIVRPEPQNSAPNYVTPQLNDFRLSNLDPTVARLVQNNPNLTIRSYSRSAEKPVDIIIQPQVSITEAAPDMMSTSNTTPEPNIKRVYRCGDCNEKFENKSVLYYHKINSCIIKKHYECAFCRKKFGTYDQYNTHLFYVHPE